MGDSENTENRILEAAEAEFLEQGYDGARTISIAERAGVTHAMLHYYFRTKEQLFHRILEEKVDALVHSVITAFTNPGKPFLQRIEEGISAHFDFLASNPKIPLFIVREIGKRDLGIEDKLHGNVAPLFMKIQSEINELADKGEVKPIDPVMLFLDIISQNVFPFMIFPIVAPVLGITDRKALLERVKQENIELILSRLKP